MRKRFLVVRQRARMDSSSAAASALPLAPAKRLQRYQPFTSQGHRSVAHKSVAMKVRFITAIVIAFFSVGCSGPRLDTAKQSKIDADVAALIKLRHVNGATIAVVRDGQTVYEKGYGRTY
jgi:CubicO group peptidase (beta-lactamase class C family)